MSSVSVVELQRAWQAVAAGHYRDDVPGTARHRGTSGPPVVWTPAQPVLPVLGCHGCAGATTLAVALGTATNGPARVVEACGATTTGLAGCATAELGVDEHGWARGRRDDVILEHASDVFTSPDQVPVPAPATGDVSLTVLDVAWEISALLATDTDSWVTRAVTRAPVVVVVSTATVPGLRRLETVLHLLGTGPTVVAALVGPRRRAWPRHVTGTVGAATTGLDRAGRLVVVPHETSLATRGLDTRRLPAGVLAAATHILALTEPATQKSPPEGTCP